MIPFGNVDITLIRRVETKDSSGKTTVSYAKKGIFGCSWKHVSGYVHSGTSVFPNDTTICRIPAGQEKPKVGDAIFKGIDADLPASTSELEAMIRNSDGNGFRVTNVSDNSCAPIPHYAAKG